MIKWILLATVLLFASLNANAQLTGQARIDSLFKELPKAKKDTNHVNLLQRLSFGLYSTDPDKGIEYGLKGVELAKKLKWKQGQAHCYYSLGVNYVGGKSDYTKALEYFQKSLKIFEELGYKSSVANSLANIGGIYSGQSDYPKALEYYQKSLEINEELGNKSGVAADLGNIGIVYSYQSDYPKTLEYLLKALKINEELGNKSSAADNLGNIGIIYKEQSDYPKALEYYHKALKINEELGNKSSAAYNLGNIGNIYYYQSDYPKTLEYLLKALKIFEGLGNKSGIAINLSNIGNIYKEQSDYPKALEYYHKALKISEELGDKYGVAGDLGFMGGLYFQLSQDTVLSKINEETELVSLNKEINLNRSIDYSLQSIKIFEEVGELHRRSTNLKILANAYELKGEISKSYHAYKEHIVFKDSVFNEEKSEQIAALEKAREDDVNRIKIEKQEILLASKEKEKNFIIYSASGGIFSILIILVVIANQRKKSEKLLLNILPAKIAKRLKGKEKTIADDIDSATIVFLDLVGFTSFAKDKKASEVVKMLNGIFSRIDKLVSEFGLEKIKTMGDGYMAAAGVPEPTIDHAKKAIDFAIAVREEIAKFNNENGLTLNARIGLESGPLVAGVIGSSKFIYDLWGDSVNTASRMESTGLPGKIQISDNVKEELSKIEHNFELESRGKIEIKGKGTMQTYFIEKETVGE